MPCVVEVLYVFDGQVFLLLRPKEMILSQRGQMYCHMLHIWSRQVGGPGDSANEDVDGEEIPFPFVSRK